MQRPEGSPNTTTQEPIHASSELFPTWPETPWSILDESYASGQLPDDDDIKTIWHNTRPYAEHIQPIISAANLVEYAVRLNDKRVAATPELARHAGTEILASTAAIKDYNRQKKRAIQALVPEMVTLESPFMGTLSAVLDKAVELYPNDTGELAPKNKEEWERLRTICYTVARYSYLRESGLSAKEIDARVEAEIKRKIEEELAQKTDNNDSGSVQ